MSAGDVSIILQGTASLSGPLLFAGCGEYVAERGGCLDISVEGMMLAGAFGGGYVSYLTGSALAGMVAGAIWGLVVGLVHANLSHRLAANTFVVGLALNALVLGITDFLYSSIHLNSATLSTLSIPVLSSIPVVGTALFSHSWPGFLLFGLVPLTWWIVQRTRWGLELRAIGENPGAVDATGIAVNGHRRVALYWCGLLSGLGGAYLALGVVGAFNPDMTDGLGYIVIAAVIFGGWTLRGMVLGCIVFGGADSLSLTLPSIGYSPTPQLLIAMPYILAILAMLFLAKHHRGPAALARPFERGIL